MAKLPDGAKDGLSSWLPTLAGVGLFLLTTAISQWVQNQHRMQQEERRRWRGQIDDDTDLAFQLKQSEEPHDRRHQDLRELYQQRRLRDRMSYEDVSKLIKHGKSDDQQTHDQDRGDPHVSTGELGGTGDNKQTIDFSSSQVPSWSLGRTDQNGFGAEGNGDRAIESFDYQNAPSTKPLTEWNLLLLQRRSYFHTSQHRSETPASALLTTQPSGTSDVGSTITNKGGIATSTSGNDLLGEAHPNALYDFHPKNRNWRHFEHYNEKDRQRYEHAKAAKVAAAAARKLEEDSGVRETNGGKTSDRDESGMSWPNLPHPRQADCTNNTDDDHDNKDGNDQESDSPSIVSEDFDDDDARSISSSSVSSEEQFVWTKHQHRGSSNTTPAAATLVERISEGFKSIMENNDGTGSEDDAQEQTRCRPLNPVAASSQKTGWGVTDSNKLPSQSAGKRANGLATAQRSASYSGRSTKSDAFNHIQKPFSLVKRILSLGSAEETKATTTEEARGPTRADHNPHIRPRPAPNSSEAENRALRAEYNARIMPEKVVLIRHGQSMGNANEVLYATTPDNSIPLTDVGWEEARSAGKILKEKILTPNESVHFIVSPYVRTVETFHGLVSAWCDPTGEEFASITDHDEKVKAWYRRLMELGLTWNEDSRLREQDFGNYQKPEVIKRAKEERHRFGAFYYRFPHGESASDVFDRVSTFLDSLWRSFEMNKSRNYVLVTHGIVLRVLLARYFRYTIDQFNMLANPRNCEMVVLGHCGEGKLDLEGRCALDVEEEPETQQCHVTGYKFHKRLRILPRNAIRKVKIRISPND